MKLAASNIGWDDSCQEAVFAEMRRLGFQGLEAAPTRVFPERPYERLREAADWAARLREERGLAVCSLQSIWFGRGERIADPAGYGPLLSHTEAALRFAGAAGCPVLVLGCPKNRTVELPGDEERVERFLAEAAGLAAEHGAVIALEPNPAIYGTNFANTTWQAAQTVRRIGCPALGLNLDIGALVENREELRAVEENMDLIRHVHLSEPWLAPIRRRPEHRELAALLRRCGYGGFVSLEMKRTDRFTDTLESLRYLAGLFQEG